MGRTHHRARGISSSPPARRYRAGGAAPACGADGAALLAESGEVFTGCNVENASYGLTLCAECALVSALHMTGGGQLVAFVCVNGNGES